MSSEKSDYIFLQGGGEMGKLIRAKDWINTPLGDPNTWPQSLRTMVSVLLDNPFGMYIAWGKEYTQIYNDGYRPILGAKKHPKALGISTRETFSEIWHIIESMFDGVMDGVAVGFSDFMLPLNRNGYIETCYFDFAYSPIRLESGEVGGVLVTVIETTSKKKAVEDLKESEDRFRTMAEATNVFIAVGDESSGATYFNKAWTQLTGRSMEELLKFGWLDLVHPEEKESILNIYLDAFKKRESFTGEFRVLNSEGGEYRWLLTQANPRFRTDGSFAGYISSCVDITNQKNNERELKDKKDELLFAIEAAELGTWDYNPISNKFSANDRLKEWFGLPADKEIELTDAINVLDDSDKERVTSAIQTALEYSMGGVYDVEYSIINPVTKKESIVHAKGKSWFRKDKIVYRLNGTLEDVTEQVLARRKIEESEQNLRLMILQAPVAISIFRGTDYRVEIVNKYSLELWGRTEEQVLNISIFDSMPELKSQGIKELLDDVAKTGNRFATAEMPIQLLRNEVLETVYINFSYEALYDGNGKINGIMAIGFDVSTQVEARRKVEESETRYNLMLMQSPFAFLILKGKDLVVQLVNESMIEVLGKGSNIEGKPLLQILPELEGQAFLDLLNNVYTTGIPLSVNEMLVKLTRNGKLEDVYFNYVYQPYYEADKSISGVTLIAYDVTSAVLTKKEIEVSQQRYHNLIHSSPSAIGILSGEDLIITIGNDSIFEIWGKGKDIMGKPYFDVLPELEEQGYKDIYKKVYDTGTPYTAIATPVYILQSGEMNLKYYTFILFPQRNIDGKVNGIGIIATDVTEQAILNNKIKESEQKYRELSLSLEEKVNERTEELYANNLELTKSNKELESFSYISSHDLQEPLRQIQIFASRILTDELKNLSEKGKDDFKKLSNAAKRMSILISDLLAYSRTKTADRKFKLSNLNEVIDGVIEEFEEIILEKQAVIEVEGECNANVILFQFRQLMHNLIGNALKFSRSDIPSHIRIKIRNVTHDETNDNALSPNKEYCHISVSDNGIGFKPEYKDRIFEVFQRLHDKQKIQGTGIGLAIVKKIVENHNGIITATGEPNIGATFDIYIPDNNEIKHKSEKK